MRRRTPPAQSSVAHREMLLRPPDKTNLQKTRDFIWDKQNKTCLTRTPLNWISITVYYFIFLAGIILIFALSLSISYYITQNEHTPQYILDESPIGSTPAMNFFPMDGDKNLIWVTPENPWGDYITSIDKMFASRKETNPSLNASDYGDCSKNPYGYGNTPCVFLRLNKVIMWEPTAYAKGDAFPENMPSEVVAKINKEANPKIWVSCVGATAKDRDLMNASVFQVQGSTGFDTTAFPYNNQDGYLDPIVAVKLDKPSIPKKIMLSFTCSYWAKNTNEKTSRVDVNIYFE